MRSKLSTFLRMHGQTFRIERNHEIIHTSEGLPSHEDSTKRPYVGFLPGTDVKSEDWIINAADERFYIEDATTHYIQKQPYQLKAYYLTEMEHKAVIAPNQSAVFNIGTAYGSIIGTQSHVTLNYNDCIQQLKEQINASDSEDKEQLNQIAALLEMIVNNQIPASKGLLSKFSSAMERNSWMTGSIMSTLMNWLLTQLNQP